MSHHELDARRIMCPLPVIRTQDKIKTLKPGDVLTVTCTDPGAANDIPAWCRINGHKLLELKQENNEVIVTIEVVAEA